MKRIFLLLLVLIMTLSLITSCGVIENIIGSITGEGSGEGNGEGNKPDDGDKPGNDDDSGEKPEEDPGDKPEDKPGEDPEDKPEDKPEEGDDEVKFLYNDFTFSEKAIFTRVIGATIPFAPNNEYYVEEAYDEYYEKDYVAYYTFGNSQSDFDAYLALFTDYELTETFEDDYGDTWYCLEGPAYIELSYYYYEGDYVIDVYAYSLSDDEGSGDVGGDDIPGGDVGGDYLYTEFTSAEKALFTQIVGAVVPFIPTNEYYVEEYYDEYYEETCISYYTFDNTESDFNAYRGLFTDYELVETYEDDYGDTWYCYDGPAYVEMCYYYYEGHYVVDIYVYTALGEGGGDAGGDTPGGDTPGGDVDSDYLYTEFTSADKLLFTETVGATVPFIPTNEYYVEKIYDEYYEEDCINYYTYGNTQSDFDAYLDLLYDYEITETFEDDYGDTWYCLDGPTYIEICFYYYEGEYVIDAYVYTPLGSDVGGGDVGGGDGNDGNDGNIDIITNAGAGLPEGIDGVFDVDFSDATNVKDVTDQGYYLDGCPTTGSPAVLVIPVEFSDSTAQSKGCSIDKIIAAFCGESGSTEYYSVDEYYYISSYGQLDLDITVIDQWFRPQYSSSYYKNATQEYFGSEEDVGDQMVLDEALAYLSTFMDLSKFDSDGNGIIDSVVLINTLEIGDDDFNWAYRYWNTYTDADGYYYEYDGVSANDYLWASYFFLQESYDANGDTIYTDTSVINPYTFIHEFGHVLGADDYYDTSYSGNHPLDGCDIMDGMTGDHNPYSKFNYGWITDSRLVTTDGSITLTLDSFTKTGDTIIIANNWDVSLGAYQEYYVIMYYTQDGLNGGDYGYFIREGIVVYHVNSSLYREEYDGEIYYDVYNTNTDPSDQYGTKDNLIEFVRSGEGNITYVAGDSLPAVTDDQGNTLCYSFTVDALDENSATITFSKN